MKSSEETGNCEVFHPSMADVQLTLKNAQLWKEFHNHGTEMIITKSGRRMFPSLRCSVKGLEPDTRYFVLLEAAPADGRRYKFANSDWTPVGGAEPQAHPSARIYVHPDSPATGSTWMGQDLLFHRAKLTNNTLDSSGNLVLTSMHKYQPKIHIVKASDILALHWSPTVTVTFPETQFIAVTAYQNEKITKLKIDNNPFAKGFRESGQARTKRKNATRSDEDEDEDEEKRKKRLETIKKETTDDSGISVGSGSPRVPLSPPPTPTPPPLQSPPLMSLYYPPPPPPMSHLWPLIPPLFPYMSYFPHLPPPPPPPLFHHLSFSHLPNPHEFYIKN